MGCGSSSEANDFTEKSSPNDQYEKLNILGCGASCKVLAVRHKETAKMYAMKILKKDVEQNDELWKSEVKILQSLKHPNILEYVDSYKDPKSLIIITSLCEGGELFDRVKEQEGSFSEKVASRLTKMMLQAVAFCHENRVIHRDLKPENFVFATNDPDSPMKLIDFGCAEQVADSKIVTDVAGSPYYVAPEVLDKNFKRTGAVWKASDMWSIGVIIFLFVCGYPPFNAVSQSDIFAKIRNGNFRFPRPSEVKLSDSVKDLIRKLLKRNVPDRITAKEALRHPWIAGDTATDTPIPTKVIESFKEFRSQQKLKKAVGRVLGNQMTEEDKKELAKVFEKFDENGDGKLGPEEIAKMMQHIGHGDPEAMLKHLDDDEDGTVDLAEFQAGHAAQQVGDSAEQVKKTFEMFDKDGDGFVTGAEIEELCDFLSPDVAGQLIKDADESGDGRIDMNEWIKAMADGSKLMHNRSDD